MPRTLDSCETNAGVANQVKYCAILKSDFDESENQIAHVNQPDLNPRFKLFETQNEPHELIQNN